MTNVREVNLVFKMLVIFLNIKILARYTAKSVIFFKNIINPLRYTIVKNDT